MKKGLVVYSICVLIAAIICLSFLANTRFSVNVPGMENISMKDYNVIAKGLYQEMDSVAQTAYEYQEYKIANQYSSIATAFGIGQMVSLLPSVLLLLAFGMSFLRPIQLIFRKVVKKEETKISSIFGGVFFPYAGVLFMATLAVYLPKWWIFIATDDSVNYEIIYTTGSNYLWGLLFVSVVFLIGRIVCGYMEKTEEKK